MSTNHPKTILLTGATGFLGSHILRTALADPSGYHVRIVVRSASKAALLLETPILRNVPESSYTIVTIPDLGTPGIRALAAAADGADYIIHTAAPLPWNDVPEAERYDQMVKPAIESVQAVLEAAKQSGTVVRVVYTSSIIVTVPLAILFGPVESDKLWVSSDRADAPQPPFANIRFAYIASKVEGLKAGEEWMRQNKSDVNFDFVALAPPYIIGRNDLLSTSEAIEANTSNARWFSLLKGKSISDEPMASTSVSVEDCARLHVLALSKLKADAGNSRVFAFGKDVEWEGIVKTARQKFPGAVEKGWIKEGGKQPTKKLKVDIKETEDALGIKLQGLEGMVESLVGQWVEVLEKEEAEGKKRDSVGDAGRLVSA